MKLTECPRDAMQGIHNFIPTQTKIKYLNTLLKVGFDVLDFGSFVSPKSVPQMADTAEVLAHLNMDQTSTKLLAIVLNTRGANDAAAFDQVTYLGYPFSVSETFQQRNANSSIEESLERVEELCNVCTQNNKTPLVYLSMAFGNPYGDPWSPELVTQWAQRLYKEFDIRNLALADTIGSSSRVNITPLFKEVIKELPQVEVGAHLHTTPGSWREKMEAAYAAGCRKFDGALGGWGGCPMAADTLTGNMATEKIIDFCQDHRVDLKIDNVALAEARSMLNSVFNV